MESIPYDKRSGKIWFNGKTVDWADANIHVLNHGLHYASCVFEGERVYDGNIFKLEEHTSRFFYSAKRMGFKIPYSEGEINNATKKIETNSSSQQHGSGTATRTCHTFRNAFDLSIRNRRSQKNIMTSSKNTCNHLV